MMDSFFTAETSRTKDSQPPRSRSNSHLSATAARLQNLNLDSSVRSLEEHEGALSEAATTSAPSFLDPAAHQSHQNLSDFTSVPTLQQYTPFPILSESDFPVSWIYNTSTEESLGTAPEVRLDPVCNSPQDSGDQSGGYPDSSRSNSTSVSNMRYDSVSPVLDTNADISISTVGVQQYDNRGFESTGVRQSFTWPRKYIFLPRPGYGMLTSVDYAVSIMGDQFLQQQLSPGMTSGQLTPYDGPKLMYARSLSSSPPQGNLTPEQRELKRQRDHARRDSKTRMRRDRSLSNPYSTSQRTSPNLLARNLTDFPSTLAPSPLLSQSSPSLANSNYLSAPYSSPLISDQGAPDMYGTMFPMYVY